MYAKSAVGRCADPVTVVEPAAVASSFVDNVGFDWAQARPADDPYAPALRAYIAHAAGRFETAQSAEDAGRLVAGVLEDAHPAFRVQTSDAARRFAGLKLADLDGWAVQRMTGSWLA